ALYGHGLVHYPFSRTTFYSALASPGPPLRLGPVSARNSIQHSPHQALAYVSAPFRLEILFSTRLTRPSPASRPRCGSKFYSALASPGPPLRLGPVAARNSFADNFCDGGAHVGGALDGGDAGRLHGLHL